MLTQGSQDWMIADKIAMRRAGNSKEHRNKQEYRMTPASPLSTEFGSVDVRTSGSDRQEYIRL